MPNTKKERNHDGPAPSLYDPPRERLVGENPLGRAQSGDIVPTGTSMLRWRARVIIEGAQAVYRSRARVDAVGEVASGDGCLYGEHIIETARVGIEQRVGKAVRMSSLLIGQRHQAGKNGAGEARAADA